MDVLLGAIKRALGVSLGLLVFSGAAPAVKTVNYNAFGIDLLQRLAPQAKNQNAFISPLSIGIALSMAADGAQGQTRAAILHALGVSNANLAQANAALASALARNTDAKVAIANAIWLRQDLPPRAAYVELLAREYGAQAQALRFGDPSAAAAINAWTKAHTLGLIDHLIGQTDKSDFSYLTNALAFTADWSLPFKKEETRPRAFTNADGSVANVPMMSQIANFQTAKSATSSVLRMPYGKGGYAAYIILPSSGNSVQDVLRSLSSTSVDRLAHEVAPQRLQAVIPRFTAKYDVSLGPVLKALGMEIAFTDRADFSPMHAPPPGILISDVHHAAYVRVDEKGTTAAAATAVGFSTTSLQQVPAFIVDHPFVVLLRDERSGALLFMGAINKMPGN